MKISAFRVWLQSMWLDHVDEIREWTGSTPSYTAEDYFRSYRWWLRTIYRNRG
jgi:hypothetical protein